MGRHAEAATHRRSHAGGDVVEIGCECAGVRGRRGARDARGGPDDARGGVGADSGQWLSRRPGGGPDLQPRPDGGGTRNGRGRIDGTLRARGQRWRRRARRVGVAPSRHARLCRHRRSGRRGPHPRRVGDARLEPVAGRGGAGRFAGEVSRGSRRRARHRRSDHTMGGCVGARESFVAVGDAVAASIAHRCGHERAPGGESRFDEADADGLAGGCESREHGPDDGRRFEIGGDAAVVCADSRPQRRCGWLKAAAVRRGGEPLRVGMDQRGSHAGWQHREGAVDARPHPDRDSHKIRSDCTSLPRRSGVGIAHRGSDDARGGVGADRGQRFPGRCGGGFGLQSRADVGGTGGDRGGFDRALCR